MACATKIPQQPPRRRVRRQRAAPHCPRVQGTARAAAVATRRRAKPACSACSLRARCRTDHASDPGYHKIMINTARRSERHTHRVSTTVAIDVTREAAIGTRLPARGESRVEHRLDEVTTHPPKVFTLERDLHSFRTRHRQHHYCRRCRDARVSFRSRNSQG